jgi:organic hydroperoxide reductase OsmC/OhrA
MIKQHFYSTNIEWTGNTGAGTQHYQRYERSHTIQAPGKPVILGSSDVAFRGDAARYNPEELLVSSLSACHMLWYLHLCSAAEIIVTHYQDNATGTMIETADGGGRFTEVVLNPMVVVAKADMIEPAMLLHEKAHALCFIANSVNFPVLHRAVTTALSEEATNLD